MFIREIKIYSISLASTRNSTTIFPLIWAIPYKIKCFYFKVGCGAIKWFSGGEFEYTTAVVCQYASPGNIIGGYAHTFDIGEPCSTCKTDCDPNFFGGVLCN